MNKRELTEKTIRAVELGKLSTDELVRACLSKGDGFKAWLEKKVKTAKKRPIRTPTIRKYRKISSDLIQQAIERVKRKTVADDAVTSVHWGVKERNRNFTGQGAIIILVTKKLAEDELENPYPPYISIETGGGRTIRIPTDVQETPGYLKLQQDDTIRPGWSRNIRVGDYRGSLGGFIFEEDDFGSDIYAIISGHVARKTGNPVYIEDTDSPSLGSVACVDLDNNDIAISGPVPDGSIVEEYSLNDREIIDPWDLYLTGNVRIRSGLGGTQHSSINDINCSMKFDYDEFGFSDRTLDGLIRLKPKASKNSDSGAPALNEDGKLIGFVVGTDNSHRFTYLLPARRAIDVYETM